MNYWKTTCRLFDPVVKKTWARIDLRSRAWTTDLSRVFQLRAVTLTFRFLTFKGSFRSSFACFFPVSFFITCIAVSSRICAERGIIHWYFFPLSLTHESAYSGIQMYADTIMFLAGHDYASRETRSNKGTSRGEKTTSRVQAPVAFVLSKFFLL